MRRAATLLAAPVAATLVLAACGGDDGDETTEGENQEVTLTLNWVPYGEHAPFYYGLEQGFYEEEGIDLTVQAGNGSGNTIRLVAQEHTDFGWADTPPLLHSVGEGLPVKSVGVYLQKGPASIEFFSDQGISSPADLEGKTVGGTPGDAMYQTFPAWLRANGVPEDAVQVANVDAAGKIPALVEGRVDAIMGFFHDQAPTIENETGKQVDVLLYSDWGMNVLGTGIVVHDKTLSDDPDLVEAFVRATTKSWQEAMSNQEAAVQAMASRATEAPPEEVLLEQLAQTEELLALDTAPAPGVNTEAAWQETIDLLSEHADLKEAGDPSKYWDSSYSPEQ